MNYNDFIMYIILIIFIFFSCIFYIPLCCRNKKLDTITVEKHNPGILIADYGITIVHDNQNKNYNTISNKQNEYVII